MSEKSVNYIPGAHSLSPTVAGVTTVQVGQEVSVGGQDDTKHWKWKDAMVGEVGEVVEAMEDCE